MRKLQSQGVHHINHIDQAHLADVIEALTLRSRKSLSEDRSAKSPY